MKPIVVFVTAIICFLAIKVPAKGSDQKHQAFGDRPGRRRVDDPATPFLHSAKEEYAPYRRFEAEARAASAREDWSTTRNALYKCREMQRRGFATGALTPQELEERFQSADRLHQAEADFSQEDLSTEDIPLLSAPRQRRMPAPRLRRSRAHKEAAVHPDSALRSRQLSEKADQARANGHLEYAAELYRLAEQIAPGSPERQDQLGAIENELKGSSGK